VAILGARSLHQKIPFPAAGVVGFWSLRAVVAFELKSPRDDWVFDEQFDAVNPDHKQPNILVLVNHAAGRTRSDLHVVITGIQVSDGTRLFTMKPDKQKRVWQAARCIDLFLWVDAQKRTCQHVYPDDAVHRAAACGLLGIEIGKEDRAPDPSSAST
jgi:hypothetical protein